MNSLNIKKCSRLLQSNKLVISPLQKHGSKDGPVLSFVTKYWFGATHHLNVEAIFFAIGLGRRSRLI